MPDAHWHHIDGDINPADIASRDISRSISSFKSWWHGPDKKKLYPTSSTEFSCDECPERLKSCHQIHFEPIPEWDVIFKYYCYRKLLRVTAWCLSP